MDDGRLYSNELGSVAVLPLLMRDTMGAAVDLCAMASGPHSVYLLRSPTDASLLFDGVHIDAIFHTQDDPLAVYYPTEGKIMKSFNDGLEHLLSIIDRLQLLQKGLDGLLPEEVRNDRAEPGEDEIAAYTTLTFPSQVHTLHTLVTITDRQSGFLQTFNETVVDENAIVPVLLAYERLHSIAQDLFYTAKIAEGIYGPRVPASLGHPEECNLPTGFTADDTTFVSYFLSRPINQARASLATDGAPFSFEEMNASLMGRYSTSPDLRRPTFLFPPEEVEYSVVDTVL